MDQAQMILEIWRMFLRRFWIFAVVGGLGSLVAGFFAYVLPPRYEAQAKILIESQQIPDDLARSMVTASAAERLQLIQQRLMTRENVRRLIEELNLFRDRPDLSVSEKIEIVRLATEISPVGDAQSLRRGEVSAFTISVVFGGPVEAARIADELVTTVLSQNIEARARLASETLEFFANEEKRLAGELAAVEAEITAFKKEHERALPDSLEFRRLQLTQAIESDRETDQRLLELEERRGSLNAALQRTAFVEPPAVSFEQQQLRELEAQLRQKRAVYAESHHEIRALRAQVEALSVNLPSPETEDGAADPREAELESIRNQVRLLDSQVAILNDYKERLAKTRAELQASLEETPRVETMLNALYRRHAALQAQYGEIVRKRTEAETGEKLEVNQQAERFEVIENPIVPEEPISPNRKKVVMLGSAVSMAIAIGIAFLVEILRPAIRSAAQMERQLELRPVVSIPYIRTRSERRRRMIGIAIFVCIIFAGIPAALYTVNQHYMPLELVGTKLAEKTGVDEAIRTIEERL